jgi:ParB-like chromosome segregation protein Spo0J
MSLKITSEDAWLHQYIREHGHGVKTSPNYLALTGNHEPLKRWFEFIGQDWQHRLSVLQSVLKSVIDHGQLEPIYVYKDGRINTGHKRCAVLMFLNKETVKAVEVPDDFKL